MRSICLLSVQVAVGSCFISRAAKTENPVPRSFFAPKPNGNACYAGYSGGERVDGSCDR